MSSELYRFESYQLDVRRSRLMRDGAEVALRPKAFDLLHHLLRNADRLLTRDELTQALWPGVVVTDDSLSRCISDLRSALGDGDQRLIKTVARRGYRFAAPVEAAVASPDPTAVPLAAAPVAGTTRSRGRRWAWAAALAATLLVIGAALAWQIDRTRPPEPATLSMVVLPFAAADNDRPATVVAQLLTEGLTVALARLHGARVIAAGTARRYQGQPLDPRLLETELGVRYALQGSVVALDGVLRVSTVLVDTQGGKMVWTDQFDVPYGELPRLQHDIVMRVAHASAAELVRDASGRSQAWQGQDLAAEDLALQCEAASRVQQGESGAPSFELCERALAQDPNNARALVRLAMYHGDRVERMQSPDPAGDVAKARAWVDRALAAAPAYDAVHCAHAVVLSAEGRVANAVAAAERCIELNPSNAYGYRILAALHYFLVEPDRTLFYVDRGIRLSPRDPQLAGFLLFKGWALLQQGHDEEALVWLRKAASVSPDSPSILAPLTAALALCGRDAEARETLARYLASKRTRSRTLAQWDAPPGRSVAFQRFSERFKDGLRKAGMPER